MALGLNDINKNKEKKSPLIFEFNVEKEVVKNSSNLELLSEELKHELDKAESETKKFSELKRPWESFSIDEMTSHLRAEKAVLKAQKIKERNEKLVKELRERSELFMKNPERFFNN